MFGLFADRAAAVEEIHPPSRDSSTVSSSNDFIRRFTFRPESFLELPQHFLIPSRTWSAQSFVPICGFASRKRTWSVDGISGVWGTKEEREAKATPDALFAHRFLFPLNYFSFLHLFPIPILVACQDKNGPANWREDINGRRSLKGIEWMFSHLFSCSFQHSSSCCCCILFFIAHSRPSPTTLFPSFFW